ncbi:hypothetical protein Moror_8499 [Moniliophthora roreri MCA 2997]|uniref:Uncharacterized protein n=1 Tax=Moniliophthora roreri (strain MCA 2997) TaxID=1381753 RepID=V2WGT7_MONRO|nr:hypothetical protein Moror_8499 [Moniliophthora roreri MCA 2997]
MHHVTALTSNMLNTNDVLDKVHQATKMPLIIPVLRHHLKEVHHIESNVMPDHQGQCIVGAYMCLHKVL